MTDNAYYNPEALGWQMIESIDFGESYEFDLYVFFKDENGKVRFGTDAGCSCPVPFETYGPKDYEVLTNEEWRQVKAEMRSRVGGDYATLDAVQYVISKVNDAMPTTSTRNGSPAGG